MSLKPVFMTDVNLASSQQLYLQFRHNLGYAEMGYPTFTHLSYSNHGGSDLHSPNFDSTQSLDLYESQSNPNLTAFLQMTTDRFLAVRNPIFMNDNRTKLSSGLTETHTTCSTLVIAEDFQYEMFTEIPRFGYVSGAADVLLYERLTKNSSGEILCCGPGGLDHLRLCLNIFEHRQWPSTAQVRQAIILMLITSIEAFRLVPVLLTNLSTTSFVIFLKLPQNGYPLVCFKRVHDINDFLNGAIFDADPYLWFWEFLSDRGFKRRTQLTRSICNFNFYHCSTKLSKTFSARQFVKFKEGALSRKKKQSLAHCRKIRVDPVRHQARLKRGQSLRVRLPCKHSSESKNTQKVQSTKKKKRKKNMPFSNHSPSISFDEDVNVLKEAPVVTSLSDRILEEHQETETGCIPSDQTNLIDSREQEALKSVSSLVYSNSIYSKHQGERYRVLSQAYCETIAETESLVGGDEEASRNETGFIVSHQDAKEIPGSNLSNAKSVSDKGVRRSSRPSVVITTTASEAASRLPKLQRHKRSTTATNSSKVDSHTKNDSSPQPRKRRGRPRKQHTLGSDTSLAHYVNESSQHLATPSQSSCLYNTAGISEWGLSPLKVKQEMYNTRSPL